MKKLLTLLLALGILGSTVPVFAAEETQAEPLPAWAYGEIADAYAMGLVGDEIYTDHSKPVTQEQLDKMIKVVADKLALLGVERYDLVLLDLNLPKKDGMTVLRTLRQTDRETRVLILSARSEVEDKVQGLDAGANDYLAKPFHLAELEARIRSLTLRQFTQQDVLLSCGGLTFDTRSRTATVNGQTLALTRKETGILEYLMVHQGRPVSQEELMDHVWDNSVDSFSNSIRVHISALRKKLRAVLGYDPIRNRIGEGYLMGGEEE